jgi:hypothetical protein
MMCLNPQGRSDAVLAEYVYLTNPVEHQTSGLSVRRQCRMEVQMNAERLIDDPVEIDVLPRTFRRLRPCTQWPANSQECRRVPATVLWTGRSYDFGGETS